MFHKHNWNLIDKTVIPPAKATPAWRNMKADGYVAVELFRSMDRQHLGYVVLTFKCKCGEVKVEEH